MRFRTFFAPSLLLAFLAAAQQPPKPTATLTAEQILEKSIEASGGRAEMEKLTSMHVKGTLEFLASEMHSNMEIFSKAPNKQLVVMNLEGVGQVKQAFDGQVAWSQDPMGNIQETTGPAAEDMKRAAAFNAALKWRELYQKVELAGEEPLGEGRAYVIRLVPAVGTPEMHYFDTRTFLMVRQTGRRKLPQGEMDVTADFSDYRDVNGIKAPFRIKQTMGTMGEIQLAIGDIKYNVPIDDSMFTKPTTKQ